MLHHLFTILSAISLLLCVGTCVLWVRSWRYGESMERVSSDRRYMATSMAGLITATRWDGPFEPGVAMEFDGRASAWDMGAVEALAPESRAFPAQPAHPISHTSARSLARILNGGRNSALIMASTGDKPRPNAIPLHDWILGTWSGPRTQSHSPLLGIAVAFLVLPSFAAIRTIRHMMRARIGCCPNCGYDLRASADRCPECGTAVARAALNS